MASFLSGLMGLDSGKATQKAAGQNLTALAGMWERGKNFINTGEAKSADYLTQAAGQFQPWQQTGTAANTMVGNALGLNGQAGTASALANFDASGAVQAELDRMQQATSRGAAAGGQLASGNLLTALQDRASTITRGGWQSYLDHLMGVSQQGQAAAGQTANALINLGGLYQGTTDQRLGLNNTFTSGLIGANNQYAQGKEAQNAGLASLGSSLGGLTGKFLGFL